MNSKINSAIASRIISAVFILLWTYSAGSKLTDFAGYQLEMQRQVFSPATAEVLVYIIPILELIAVGMLLPGNTNKAGLAFSLLLISVFTGYILLIITGYFPHVPCSCGGVISGMGWKSHLLFNVVFLTAAIIALSIKPKREGGDKE